VGWKKLEVLTAVTIHIRYSILKGSTRWKFEHLTEDVHPDCSAIFNGPSLLIEETVNMVKVKPEIRDEMLTVSNT
jgi:hypothetical protein